MIIFSTCHDDSTEISYLIAQSVVESDDIFLQKEDAIMHKLTQVLREHPSLPLFGFCHGENDYWVGNDDNAALDIKQIEYLQNRKIYAYACRTANGLGVSISSAIENCFYWGCNSAISVGDKDFLTIISPILSYIKIYFHQLETSETILLFLENLKQKCDSLTEQYNTLWAEDWNKFSIILQLTQTLRDIWAKLLVSFQYQSIHHPEAIEASLW